MELSMVGFWRGFFSRSIIFIHMCATMLLVYGYFYKKKKKKSLHCLECFGNFINVNYLQQVYIASLC